MSAGREADWAFADALVAQVTRRTRAAMLEVAREQAAATGRFRVIDGGGQTTPRSWRGLHLAPEPRHDDRNLLFRGR